MTEKVKKYLSDILQASELIVFFVEGINSFDDYVTDLKTRSAVERQLAILGEALNKIRAEEVELNITNDQKIIGFRKRLIHAYDSIDPSIVWVIVKNYLPELQKEVSLLLEK